jgi:hypothetical protein
VTEINERIVLLISANFAKQEDCIQDQACGDHSKENNSQHEEEHLTKLSKIQPTLTAIARADRQTPNTRKNMAVFLRRISHL